MNRLVAVLVLVVLVLGGALLFILARPEAARRTGVPMASGPAGDPDAGETAAGEADSGAEHIPPQFQGVWAPDRLSCTRRGETARVEIDADGIKFYESSGRLSQLTPLGGGREHAVALEVTGEGRSWTRIVHLRRVGHELAFRDAEDLEERLYIRC